MNRRNFWKLVGILVVATPLRLVGLGALSLVGDEAYYWLWSQRLDWAYYDHPAGIALLIRASTVLGGPSEAGVRWLNALLGVGCTLLTYWLGQRMFSQRAGLLAATLVATGAPYLITSRLVYTNTLNLLLLLLNLHAFWHLVEKPKLRLGTAVTFGVSLALLFNTKYNAYLYMGALSVAVLLDHRRMLTERLFWVGVLIGALGLAPVIAWNAAHEWASFRWQFAHATTNVTGTFDLLGNARHTLNYLTWPLVGVALVGIGRVRTPAERLISLIALFLLLPLALSPANSPRNLADGLVFLLLLAGARLSSPLQGQRRRALAKALANITLAGMALLTALYGLGTVITLFGPSSWPHSSVVPAILKDAAGWKALGPALADSPAPIFTMDYSIAPQIWYYAGRAAYTSWGQYRIWGIPDLEDAAIVSLDYLPKDVVSTQLGQAFQSVEGPQHLWYTERGATKKIYIWQVRGLQWDQETFLQQFDFLTLLEATR